MTAKEALKQLSDLHTYCFSTQSTFKRMGFEFTERFFIKVKNALDKQIPKKIDYQKVDDIIVRFCPSCKVRFLRWGHKFCGECGQRLDWSDES